ncbi:MAG: hypothetical protein IJX76_00785 [Clostridia bacterium]|nr:hypothetical protein [Clostridia bacterium]
MKKLSFLLAILATASMCLASCAGEDSSSNDQNKDTTTVATTPAATPSGKVTNPLDNNNNNTPSITPPEIIAPELLDGTKFALDGDLSEYAGLHTLEVIGEKATDDADYSHKKVTFYGAMTDAGLYLACDAYHDIYIGNGTGEWWTNTNFEIFIGASNAQKYAYARGIDAECETSGDDVTAIMVTEELTDGPTVYHSITEMFIPTDYLSDGDIMYNTMDVGVAWKTLGDLIIGGAANVGPNGEDEYWVPKGTWPNRTKPIVAPSGIWLPDEFEFEYTGE